MVVWAAATAAAPGVMVEAEVMALAMVAVTAEAVAAMEVEAMQGVEKAMVADATPMPQTLGVQPE